MNADLILTSLALVGLLALVVPYKLPGLGLVFAGLMAIAGVLLSMTPAETVTTSGCFIGHCGTTEVTSSGLESVFGVTLLVYAGVWVVVAVIRLSRQAPQEDGGGDEEGTLPRAQARRS